MLGFSIYIAIFLKAVGLISAYLGYVGGSKIGTALIPVGLGAVILISSLIGTSNDGLRKHMMHLNMLVALAGVALVIVALGMSGAFTQGFRSTSQAIGLIGMLLGCAVLLAAGIRSFIAARAGQNA